MLFHLSLFIQCNKDHTNSWMLLQWQSLTILLFTLVLLPPSTFLSITHLPYISIPLSLSLPHSLTRPPSFHHSLPHCLCNKLNIALQFPFIHASLIFSAWMRVPRCLLAKHLWKLEANTLPVTADCHTVGYVHLSNCCDCPSVTTIPEKMKAFNCDLDLHNQTTFMDWKRAI